MCPQARAVHGETGPGLEQQQLVVQPCLLTLASPDPYSVDKLGDKLEDKGKRGSYISTFVEEEGEQSGRHSLKTLSDGGSLDDDDDDKDERVTELHKIQSELQEVVEKIDASISETQEARGRDEELPPPPPRYKGGAGAELLGQLSLGEL